MPSVGFLSCNIDGSRDWQRHEYISIEEERLQRSGWLAVGWLASILPGRWKNYREMEPGYLPPLPFLSTAESGSQCGLWNGRFGVEMSVGGQVVPTGQGHRRNNVRMESRTGKERDGETIAADLLRTDVPTSCCPVAIE